MTTNQQATLTRIRFGGYKCFAEEQTLEIRPLTILLGRNNSGKSAVARLVLLVAAGMATRAKHPLDLRARGIDFGDSFLDLVTGREPHRSLTFQLLFQGADGEHSLDVSVLGVARAGRAPAHHPAQIVQSWKAQVEGQALSLAWQSGSDLQRPVYDWILGSKSGEVVAPFAGMSPDIFSFASSFVEDLVVNQRGLFEACVVVPRLLDERICYLGPLRAKPQRYYRLPQSMTFDVGNDGWAAPGVLAADQEMGDGKLLAAVNGWFEKHHDVQLDINRYVGPETDGATFSLLVRSLGRVWTQGVDRSEGPGGRVRSAVTLPDVGAGIAQVLPIVVQHFLSLGAPTGDARVRDLFVCEQPELHLHPAAHAGLGDLFIDLASSGRTQIVVETHSENLLLRIRRRVAEGRISPDSIALYWVNDDDGTGSMLQRLTIEEDGWVEGWPDGVFAEDTAEARALGRAARERHERGTGGGDVGAA